MIIDSLKGMTILWFVLAGVYGALVYMDLGPRFQEPAEKGLIVLGGLIVMPTLGISITPLLTALGVGGIAVALAFQQTLLNLFSGLHILAYGQVKVGDYVRLSSGEEGKRHRHHLEEHLDPGASQQHVHGS